MKVNIQGNQYFVDVHHIDSEIVLSGVSTPCRATKIVLEHPKATLPQGDNPAILEALTYCSPNEQFCRREGRRRAANRLLAKLRANGFFNKEQRRSLFEQVCPEYFKKNVV